MDSQKLEDNEENRQQMARFVRLNLMALQNKEKREARKRYLKDKEYEKGSVGLVAPEQMELLLLAIQIYEQDYEGKPVSSDEKLNEITNKVIKTYFSKESK